MNSDQRSERGSAIQVGPAHKPAKGNSPPKISNVDTFRTVDIFRDADKALKRRRRSHAYRIVSRFRNVGGCATLWTVEGQCLAKEKDVSGAADYPSVTARIAQAQ